MGTASDASANVADCDMKTLALQLLRAWLADADEVAAWANELDLAGRLQHADADGFVRVENVLPRGVAEGFYQLLSGMSDEDLWGLDVGDNDGSAAHLFSAAAPSDDRGVERGMASDSELERTVACMYNAVASLIPSKRYTLRLARYTRDHFIEAHDDAAQVKLEGGKLYEREVAIIFYFAKGWKPSFGGCLLDHRTGTPHVPAFNSMVAFLVPRWHEVTLCTTSRPRYSMFGWFLRPVRSAHQQNASGAERATQRKKKRAGHVGSVVGGGAQLASQSQVGRRQHRTAARKPPACRRLLLLKRHRKQSKDR